MKTLFLIIITTSLYSQKEPYFLTKFYFEDAVGHQKEIEIGYDTLADGCELNTQYGEILDNSEMDSIFDVRATSFTSWQGFGNCSFPKKKILISNRIVGEAERIISKDFCIGGDQLIFFINAKYQPITIRWNASDFERINCKDKNWSFFTPDFTHNLVFNHEWIAHHPKYACIRDESYTFYLGKDQVEFGERPYILMHEVEGRGIDSIYGMSFNNDQTFYYCDPRYVGIDDYFGNYGEVEIFPNPAIDYFVLELKDYLPEYLTMTLINSYGDKVIQKTIGQGINTIELESIPSGLYIINLKDRNGWIMTEKLQILH